MLLVEYSAEIAQGHVRGGGGGGRFRSQIRCDSSLHRAHACKDAFLQQCQMLKKLHQLSCDGLCDVFQNNEIGQFEKRFIYYYFKVYGITPP